MKNENVRLKPAPRPAAMAPPAGWGAWRWLLPLAAVLLALAAYSPALYGPLLFDDIYLPFARSDAATSSFRSWLGGGRPLTVVIQRLIYLAVGQDTFPFHLFSVVGHGVVAALLSYCLYQLAKLAATEERTARVLAAGAGAIFLLHPINTEAVAYIAGTGEVVAALFYFAACALFLSRPEPAITFRRALAVVLCYGCAVAGKEHAITLPAVLLLADYYFNPGFQLAGARRNWRLYGMLAVLGAVGVALALRMLTAAATAGFGMKDFTWQQYLLTQFRAVLLYLAWAVFPAGQNIDHDFPLSRTLTDHGAVIALAVLVALVGAAVAWRQRFPLASFGFLAYLIMLAPTSSFIPIQDLVVERRLYLPLFGLLLVLIEVLRRLPIERKLLAYALAAVAALLSVLTFQRARIWGDQLAFWQDAAAKSPGKSRPLFQVAYAHYLRGECAQAADVYRKVATLQAPDYRLLVNSALANECANRPAEALRLLNEAARKEPSAHVYSQIAMVEAKQGQFDHALAHLEQSLALDPNFATSYTYRGTIHLHQGNRRLAAEDFRRALQINPEDAAAANGLAQASQPVQGIQQ